MIRFDKITDGQFDSISAPDLCHLLFFLSFISPSFLVLYCIVALHIWVGIFLFGFYLHVVLVFVLIIFPYWNIIIQYNLDGSVARSTFYNVLPSLVHFSVLNEFLSLIIYS